jgi:hypothetical protein
MILDSSKLIKNGTSIALQKSVPGHIMPGVVDRTEATVGPLTRGVPECASQSRILVLVTGRKTSASHRQESLRILSTVVQRTDGRSERTIEAPLHKVDQGGCGWVTNDRGSVAQSRSLSQLRLRLIDLCLELDRSFGATIRPLYDSCTACKSLHKDLPGLLLILSRTSLLTVAPIIVDHYAVRCDYYLHRLIR